MKEQYSEDDQIDLVQEDYESFINLKTSNAQCGQNRSGYLACINIKCENQNPIICDDKMCQCSTLHRKCLKIEINSMIDTIKQQAYPFNKVKQKIIRIFDNAIDKLSQIQQKLILKFQKLFDTQGFTVLERQFLDSLEIGLQRDITSDLMYKINSEVFQRQQTDKIILTVQQKIQKVSSQFLKQINTFQSLLQERLLELQNNFTNLPKQPVFGLFQKSLIITDRKDQEQLLKFFPQSLLGAKLIFRGSEQNFNKIMFHKFCDDIQSLLFLIRTEHKKIIGGYTLRAFSSEKRQTWLRILQTKPFIFSITQGDKLQLTNIDHSIWNGRLDGDIICGFGNDLCIGDKSNQNYSSSVKLSDAYQHLNYPNNKQGWKKFTGNTKKQFKISEWEVWKVNLDKTKK